MLVPKLVPMWIKINLKRLIWSFESCLDKDENFKSKHGFLPGFLSFVDHLPTKTQESLSLDSISIQAYIYIKIFHLKKSSIQQKKKQSLTIVDKCLDETIVIDPLLWKGPVKALNFLEISLFVKLSNHIWSSLEETTLSIVMKTPPKGHQREHRKFNQVLQGQHRGL